METLHCKLKNNPTEYRVSMEEAKKAKRDSDRKPRENKRGRTDIHSVLCQLLFSCRHGRFITDIFSNKTCLVRNKAVCFTLTFHSTEIGFQG